MSRVSIGGQAVLEGIMMKNADKYAVAVRKPNNEIEIKVDTYIPFSDKHKICGFPIIRGVFNFVESMVIGVKTLTYSAELIEDEEEEVSKDSDSDKKTEGEADKKQKENDTEKENKKSDDLLMFGTVAFSIVFAVALFMLLPAFLTSFLDNVIESHFLLSAIEGIVRLVIFMAYVVIISKMEEIKRTYMYHGAEHKCINCLEHGEDLTVENVLKHSRFHKRCGTSFLIIVMLVSILVFMFIKVDNVLLRLVYRVLLVPVIAGISYEFIKFAGRSESAIANILSKPGLCVQRLTTREPDAGMVEVAIKAVESVLDWREYLCKERAK